MIAELCSRIWSKEQFHKERMQLMIEGLRYSLTGEPSGDYFEILPRLLQCATHFSLSTDTKYHRSAYQIAVNAWKIHNSRSSKSELDTQAVAAAISLILTRLGNFPAETFLKQQLNNDNITTYPASLWLEQEFHRDENTVSVGEDKAIILTDFQRQLWKALERHRVVVVTAPTSAGKSFALQHFLAAIYAQGNLRKAVYIVPTRALISEILEDMERLIWHDLKLDVQLSEVPYPPEANERVLFVLTQERLQILLDQTKQEIEFVVVDEAQGITDGSRGIILQSVVERVRERNPNVNLLFGSPFTLNPEVFAHTFGISSAQVKVVNTEESPVAQNLIHVTTNKYKPREIEISMITEDGQQPLFVSDAGTELVREEQTLSQVSHLFGHKSLNIVYGSEPVKCEKIAGFISEIVSSNGDNRHLDPDLLEFSEFIKTHIHKDFSLSQLVKNGVAYHYGNLPAFLRKGLERLFSEGRVSFIVCTSTLLQGINLPAQNIFIMNPSKGRDVPLTPTEFWNLAGRAGRLTKDFEGNVYLINVLDWLENPLGKTKRQEVKPSFTVYLCERTEDLIQFIENVDHASGSTNYEGFENAFMKLFNDFRSGRIESVLARYGDRLSQDSAKKLTTIIRSVSENTSVPKETTDSNPNISVYRQQDMLDYLMNRITEKGPEYVVPPHPLFKYATIQNDYLRLFKRLHTYFEKKPSRDGSHAYYSNLALLWMRGITYAELLKKRIEYVNTQRRRGQANANTEARELFKEIETSLRFRYVKYTRCYIDLLKLALERTDNSTYIESIPPIYLFLELGACSKTMMSLIGLGISRTSASILSERAPRTDMERQQAARWIRSIDFSKMDFPKSVVKEVESML